MIRIYACNLSMSDVGAKLLLVTNKHIKHPPHNQEHEFSQQHIYQRNSSKKQYLNFNLTDLVPVNMKRKIHNEYVLPVMVYGSETWALKKAHHRRYQEGNTRMGGTHCTFQRQQVD